VKGAGEAGVIGAYTVVAAAVEDALAEFGIGDIAEMPLSPAAVRRLLDAADGTAPGRNAGS